mgnify:CR=1 FL=1
MSNSHNHAVTAKARALYGKRITPEQYKELLHCRSVPDIAAYLKSSTAYAEALHNISESTIHRGQLENMLRRWNFETYTKLYHYVNSSNDNLFHLIIVEFEIREILRMILLLKAGNPQEYISSLPGFLLSRCKVNLLELAKIRSFDELLKLLEHTEYETILAPFRPTDQEPVIDYISCEHSLFEAYFRHTLHMINKATKGTERQELRRLTGMRIDHLNLRSLFRGKVLFQSDRKQVETRIFPFHRLLSTEVISELLDAGSKEQFNQIMRRIFESSGAINRMPENKNSFLESYTNRLHYQAAKNYLHLSQNVSVVFYAFFVLSQIEVANLIFIIEGIRYQLPTEEIQKLIIL